MRVELGWPPKALHPNARVHWAVKGRATKAARTEAHWATKAALIAPCGPSSVNEAAPESSRLIIQQDLPVGGLLPLIVTFYPPDKRKRDDDGMISSFKAQRDGIADALGIDDNLFRPSYQHGEPVKGGKIVVEIGE